MLNIRTSDKEIEDLWEDLKQEFFESTNPKILLSILMDYKKLSYENRKLKNQVFVGNCLQKMYKNK